MKEIDKRRQKSMNRKDTDKKILAMEAKRGQLIKAKNGMRLVELPEPIRTGYKKFFVIRPDIAAGDDVDLYKQILPYVQNTIYSNNREFLVKDYKTKKMLPKPHKPANIEHKVWNTLVDAKFNSRQSGMFERVWKQTGLKNPKIGKFEYLFTKDWAFAEKIEPHYKTHTLLLDPDLESELQQINNRIDRNNLWPKINKLLGCKSNKWDYETRINRIINKYYADIAENILEYKNDK